MWQDTGAVFRLNLTDDGQFESVEGLGSGQLGGRWNTWDADRFVGLFLTRCSGAYGCCYWWWCVGIVVGVLVLLLFVLFGADFCILQRAAPHLRERLGFVRTEWRVFSPSQTLHAQYVFSPSQTLHAQYHVYETQPLAHCLPWQQVRRK